MDKKQQIEMNPIPLEQQLDAQLTQKPAEPVAEVKHGDRQDSGLNERPQPSVPQEDHRTLGVGEWMITILLFLLPIVNIVVMAVWAFSSKGNVHRKACLLWMIILLLGYVVAMTVAGYTIFDIFSGRL